MKPIPRKDLPKFLQIKDETYRYLWVDRCPGEPKSTHGLCCYESKTCWIRTKQGLEEAMSTYVHETLHAISDEYNINLTEKQVQKLEQGLMDLWLNL